MLFFYNDYDAIPTKLGNFDLIHFRGFFGLVCSENLLILTCQMQTVCL